MDRLIYKKGRKTIASKPWCFEAMCIIDDGRGNNIFDMCTKAVEYLFDGYDITKIGHDTAAGFCLRVFEWYRRDCTKISSVSKADGNGKARLRELYKTFFDGWGILPTELAKQPPQLLFGVLYGVDENGEIPDEVKILYGL